LNHKNDGGKEPQGSKLITACSMAIYR